MWANKSQTIPCSRAYCTVTPQQIITVNNLVAVEIHLCPGARGGAQRGAALWISKFYRCDEHLTPNLTYAFDLTRVLAGSGGGVRIQKDELRHITGWCTILANWLQLTQFIKAIIGGSYGYSFRMPTGDFLGLLNMNAFVKRFFFPWTSLFQSKMQVNIQFSSTCPPRTLEIDVFSEKMQYTRWYI